MRGIARTGSAGGDEGRRCLACMNLVAATAVAALVLFFASVVPASAAMGAETLGPRDPVEAEEFLDEVLAGDMERLDIPGAAIAVVREGRVVLVKGYGFADREARLPVDGSATLFGIGSVTKPLTAVAAWQQVERGGLEPAADVEDYLDFRVSGDRSSPVTLAALLTHTAGFEERRIGIAAKEANAVQPLGDYLADNVPARFADTGDVHSYCNLGYALVGHLVERSSGQDFPGYMAENVFGPLGMERSAFQHGLPTDLLPSVAVGYVGPAGERTPAAPTYERDYPAGGALTTAADMATFMIALLEDGRANGAQILEPASAAAYLSTAYRPAPTMPGRTGGGLEELWINDERAVGHGGDTLDGFGAEMVLLPERRTGFFLVYNVDTADEFREAVVAAIFDHYYPGSASQPAFADLESADLERFAGAYRQTRFARSRADKILAMTPPYNTFVSANPDGTLTVSFLGVDQTWDYRPTGPTTFTQVAGEPATIDGLVVDPGRQISFTLEGEEIRYLHTSLHTIALERVPLPLIGVVQVSSYGIVVMLFVVGLVAWALGAAVRRLRGRSVESGWALAGSWLLVAVGASLALGTLALFLGLGTGPAYGATPLLYAATGFITLGSVAGLLLLPAGVAAWWNGWFSIPGRVYYTLLALLAPFVLWWAGYWHLFGFQF